MSKDATKHILQSLFANGFIACIKGVAAFFTGSGSMAAETVHSAADCGNQMLLLLGVKQTQRPADQLHPMGYGRALYFWSFMVAMLLFTGGGVFSIYEGAHKISHQEPLEHVGMGVGILALSLLIEGAATLSNVREMNVRRGKKPFLDYLRDTKDSDLIVVFGENAAASLGLLLAALALIIAAWTGDSRWDGAGSIAIGVVLVGVAVFLAREVQSLLVGESADPVIHEVVTRAAADHPDILEVLSLITIQQGPGEVMVAIKVHIQPTLTVAEACVVINTFESTVRTQCPDVEWMFVEPDMPAV
ncbi:MAG: cation diffusion facilitator family transporter [Myxococcales bacterium]|nr:cation diffusion facilitator family transporter [Myxococcales bacterium]